MELPFCLVHTLYTKAFEHHQYTRHTCSLYNGQSASHQPSCESSCSIYDNNEFLGHDYYTDIITFDYCEGKVLNGDIYISLDTVFTNADKFGRPYDEELHRVIIHGILHLCGVNDKGPGEREIMEAAEDKALAMR